MIHVIRFYLQNESQDFETYPNRFVYGMQKDFLR